jgi:glycosyltransferase involved in cell wall biosynthesis
MDKLKIFLLSSGLGRISRGYETFTRECFEALRSQPGLTLTLFKGGGADRDGEVALWNLSRFSLAGRLLGRLTRRGGYVIEQATFFLSLKKFLRRDRPDVLYFSDGNLGNLLWHWRRKSGLRYRLLFSNGGPLSPPFPRWDLVQQVAAAHFHAATAAGQPAARQRLLPYGFAIPAALPPLAAADKAVLCRRLGLPENRPVLLSVAALNVSHKRMDYVVSELAALAPGRRPFLAMLGQRDAETPAILELAARRLGAGGFLARTVAPEQVGDHHRAADAFVLASLNEGMPRALAEALAQGLPCFAHDYAVAREVLAETGFYGDFRVPGALAGLLANALASGADTAARQARHRSAYQRFSWDVLSGQYAQMLRDCAAADILNPG